MDSLGNELSNRRNSEAEMLDLTLLERRLKYHFHLFGNFEEVPEMYQLLYSTGREIMVESLGLLWRILHPNRHIII